MKEVERERNEINGVLARNVDFSQLIVDYQRKLDESSESLNAAKEHSRKLTMQGKFIVCRLVWTLSRV